MPGLAPQCYTVCMIIILSYPLQENRGEVLPQTLEPTSPPRITARPTEPVSENVAVWILKSITKYIKLDTKTKRSMVFRNPKSPAWAVVT